MKDDVINYWLSQLPRNKKDIMQIKCSNCGNKWCRSKWKYVIWSNCKEWEPEMFEATKK